MKHFRDDVYSKATGDYPPDRWMPSETEDFQKMVEEEAMLNRLWAEWLERRSAWYATHARRRALYGWLALLGVVIGCALMGYVFMRIVT